MTSASKAFTHNSNHQIFCNKNSINTQTNNFDFSNENYAAEYDDVPPHCRIQSILHKDPVNRLVSRKSQINQTYSTSKLYQQPSQASEDKTAVINLCSTDENLTDNNAMEDEAIKFIGHSHQKTSPIIHSSPSNQLSKNRRLRRRRIVELSPNTSDGESINQSPLKNKSSTDIQIKNNMQKNTSTSSSSSTFNSKKSEAIINEKTSQASEKFEFMKELDRCAHDHGVDDLNSKSSESVQPRKRIKQSADEVRNLKAGYLKYGGQPNHQSLIISDPTFNFHPQRTNKDLKDKQVNLRNAGEVKY